MVDERTATVTFGEEEFIFKVTNIGDSLPAAPEREDYEFKGWAFDGVDGYYTELTEELLTALNGKTVTAEAVYTKESGDSGNEGGSSSGGTTETKYSIKVESAENGKVEASASKAAEGAKVTLTVSSDKGYVLKSLAVLDKDNKEVKLTRVSDGEYNFRMPESAVTVTAVFAEDEGEEEVVFTDVADDAWYYDAVMYAYNNGMMNGVSEGVFAPSMNLTRGMIAQILYNMEEVKVSADTAFSDVAEGQLRGR